jgi:hypothetical protein
MLCPFQRTVAPPPCLPLGIKDWLKEDMRLFDDERLLDVGVFLMKGNCWREIVEGGNELLAEGELLKRGLLKENC